MKNGNFFSYGKMERTKTVPCLVLFLVSGAFSGAFSGTFLSLWYFFLVLFVTAEEDNTKILTCLNAKH